MWSNSGFPRSFSIGAEDGEDVEVASNSRSNTRFRSAIRNFWSAFWPRFMPSKASRGRLSGQGSCTPRLAPRSLLLPHCPECATQGYLTFPEVVFQTRRSTTQRPHRVLQIPQPEGFLGKCSHMSLSWGALDVPSDLNLIVRSVSDRAWGLSPSLKPLVSTMPRRSCTDRAITAQRRLKWVRERSRIRSLERWRSVSTWQPGSAVNSRA